MKKPSAMKVSMAISGLIIALAAWLVWHLDARVAITRGEERKLGAESWQLRKSVDDDCSLRSNRYERPDRDVEARRLAVEYNLWAKKWESVADLDAAMSERYSEIHKRIAALDSTRLREFITDVLDDEDTSAVMRAERAVKLIPLLAKKDAKAALALFAEFYNAIKISPGAGNVVPECLMAWANYDALAAVEWIKKHRVEFPEAMGSFGGVLRETARHDPELAVTLISEFGPDDISTHSALHAIVTAAKTDDERTSILAAVRKYSDANKQNKELTSEAERMVGYFSWGFEETGIKAAKTWFASANLSPQEMSAFCDVMSRSYDGAEHAEWIDWMGDALPPDLGRSPIMDMISRWTVRDYDAAGNWLTSANDGPAKIAAIRGYALTIFKNDPETAMQWINTLPPGQDRNDTLRTIHLNWPKTDPAGAAAFAKENGMNK